MFYFHCYIIKLYYDLQKTVKAASLLKASTSPMLSLPIKMVQMVYPGSIRTSMSRYKTLFLTLFHSRIFLIFGVFSHQAITILKRLLIRQISSSNVNRYYFEWLIKIKPESKMVFVLQDFEASPKEA